MNVLFISNLFPNRDEPTRGMHNAQQVAALARHCHIVKIISPVYHSLPPESFNGIPLVHPKFFHVPLLSRPFNGWLFARAIAPALRREKFDVALVNWAYPDAYGVMLVAQKMNFPFATTVQGSDVNVFFQNPARKKQILRALRASRAVFTRSHALRDKLAAEGIMALTVYNGIDREKFHPLKRSAACCELGLDENRRRILYVGNLLPVKAPTVLAQAFQQLGEMNDVDLFFIGAGSETEKIAMGEHVKLVGAQRHEKIPLWMNASDVLCLPSLNEGLPNVALEAMACGLPVVGSNVGGVPEVVRDGVNGLLVPANDANALAAALRKALTMRWDKNEILRSVAKFDWDLNARQVLDALQPKAN